MQFALFSLRRGILTLLCLGFVAEAGAVDLDRQLAFDIRPQKLATALLEFSHQAGVQVVIGPEVGEQTTAGISGTQSIGQALTRLLEASTLTYAVVGETSITVGKAEQPAPQAQTSASGAVRLAQAASAEDPSQPPAAPPEGPQVTLEEILVTGTRIRGVGPRSSPLSTYTRKDLEEAGVATVEEFIRKLPQNLGNLDQVTVGDPSAGRDAQANSARGAGINLRGLGAGSTLVLLNGHRIAPSGFEGQMVDVSLIPLSAVERIEVLTDGASALYGADAVGGVVNFILREKFEGLEATARYGDTTRGGGAQRSTSLLFGQAWESGSATVVYDYNNQDPIDVSQRDFVPDLGFGSYHIVPDQKRHSAFAAVKQDISATTGIFAEMLYSERKYVADSTSDTFLLSTSDAISKQLNATLGLGHDFARSWHAEILGQYTRAHDLQNLHFALVGPPPVDFPVDANDTETTVKLAEARADGRLFTMPGGDARLALGSSYRTELYDRPTSSAGINFEEERKVASFFAEALLPLTAQDSFFRRLELSAAARFDDYDDFGHSLDPKVGLAWLPVDGLKLRGTWGTSFRAPPLAQIAEDNDLPQAVRITNANAPGGQYETLVLNGANVDLEPEESRSITAGFDYSPPSVPGFSLAATWYDIDYTDRILTPPLVGGVVGQVFDQLATLAPFVDFTPDIDVVTAALASKHFIDDFPTIGPASAIEVVFDSRLQNLAETRTSGIDFSARHEFATSLGDIALTLSTNYVLEFTAKSAATTPTLERVSTLYNPIDFRARAGVNWSKGALASSLFVNYADDYRNTAIPPVGDVSSWTTLDWTLRYRAAEGEGAGWLANLLLSLSVQNLADRDPPRVPIPVGLPGLGFDSANADARGRAIALTVTKSW